MNRATEWIFGCYEVSIGLGGRSSMGRRGMKEHSARSQGEANRTVHQQIYVRPISYRCYVSTFRTMCDTFSDIIPVEIEEKLKELNIYQFLQFSEFEQNAPLIYQLLTMWNIEKKSFIIEGHVVPFTADEVALLTGLPNRGEEITWMTLPSSTISSKDIKTELFELTRESSPDTMLKTFIMPAGYVNGFVPLLIIWFLEHTFIHLPKYPERRPRFLRWSDDIVYNTEKIAKLFVNLKRRQIFVDIQGVTPEECDLLGVKKYPSTPLSPIQTNTPEHHLPPQSPMQPKSALKTQPQSLDELEKKLIGIVQESMVNLFLEFEARMRKNFEQIVRRVDLIDEKLQHCIVQGTIKHDQQAAPSSSSFIPHIISSPNNIRISSDHTKTDVPEKMNNVEMTQGAERGYPASPTVNYRGVEMLSPVQEVFLRENIRKYLDTGMTIFSSGNVMVSRRMIDEILSDSYLDNDHVDAFAILLNEKSKISPDEYQKYLYISPMYWHYKVKDVKSVLFLKHIDYNSIQSSSIIINPVIDGEHWTLLVGYIKQKRWEFYDSIPNPMHRSIAVKIIASLNKDCKKAFHQNITKWSFKTMKKAPTQTNNTDCGNTQYIRIRLDGWLHPCATQVMFLEEGGCYAPMVENSLEYVE
ncbi:hypothetical protein KFK09_014190 [Dendrobium nobile]|uniref:Ubiquitin-like protease family profile domain-containing protein n=1 Tax=Dendrobium nobile TaxID=94219 RepID=A0A8T3BC96_DENNO|nr:hypothetical protein KFK09_014190 [Dendrobium nobile]